MSETFVELSWCNKDTQTDILNGSRLISGILIFLSWEEKPVVKTLFLPDSSKSWHRLVEYLMYSGFFDDGLQLQMWQLYDGAPACLMCLQFLCSNEERAHLLLVFLWTETLPSALGVHTSILKILDWNQPSLFRILLSLWICSLLDPAPTRQV